MLSHRELSSEDRHLAALLDFFGVPWKTTTAAEIVTPQPGSAGRFYVLTSASCLADALFAHNAGVAFAPWLAAAYSIYIYGFRGNERCKTLLRNVTADSNADLRTVHTPHTSYSITRSSTELCGPMSGLSVTADSSDSDVLFDVRRKGQGLQSLISAPAGDLFLAAHCRGSHFYLNACSKIIDIHSPCRNYFDVRKQFAEAVPLVMFLRSAFRNVSWQAPAANACLIVDDPPLKPRYGFLRYDEALQLMDRHNFTIAIGFIPWNWSRTDPHTANLFHRRPDRLSVCFHGSDHTDGEFASRSPAQLAPTIRTARKRMDLFSRKFAVPHTPVMVFPQGSFSPEAGRALKLGGFLAAVNTEVAPRDVSANQTTIADVWSIANLKYGSFPIFTRRYDWHGIENFAFEGLLGKPCLLVGHHEAFRDHARCLIELISRLNLLSWNLQWRTLEDVLRRSYRFRIEPDGTHLVQMYSQTLLLENPSAELRRMTLLKQETDPACIQSIQVNGIPVRFTHDGKFLRWDLELAPASAADVRVLYRNQQSANDQPASLSHNLKVTGRRYLCELRDNYLSQSDLLFKSAAKLRHLFS